MSVLTGLPNLNQISRALDQLGSGRTSQTTPTDTPDKPAGAPAFGEMVSGFLKHANEAQQHGDAMVEKLALGEPVDIHQVMLALNEASNALQLTLQVRSKILEAYSDL